jgi:hypothetical protein
LEIDEKARAALADSKADAINADLPSGAAYATTAAVGGVRACVDAGATADRLSAGADGSGANSFAAEAGLAVRRDHASLAYCAGGAGTTTAVDVGLAAVLDTVVAGCGKTGARGADTAGADDATAAAVAWIGSRADADAAAVGLPVGTGANSAGADLAAATAADAATERLTCRALGGDDPAGRDK